MLTCKRPLLPTCRVIPSHCKNCIPSFWNLNEDTRKPLVFRLAQLTHISRNAQEERAVK